MKRIKNVKINGQIKQVSVQKDGETYKYFLDNTPSSLGVTVKQLL